MVLDSIPAFAVGFPKEALKKSSQPLPSIPVSSKDMATNGAWAMFQSLSFDIHSAFYSIVCLALSGLSSLPPSFPLSSALFPAPPASTPNKCPSPLFICKPKHPYLGVKSIFTLQSYTCGASPLFLHQLYPMLG